MGRTDFLGLCDITIVKKRYHMRPSFAALYAVERTTGQSIAALIDLLDEKPAASLIKLIITEGLKAQYGQASDLPKLRSRQWVALQLDARAFLILGLGYAPHEMAPQTSNGMTDQVTSAQLENAETATGNVQSQKPRFESINWRELYKAATGPLSKSEAEFWQMTMCGLMLQSEAYAATQGAEVAEVGLPASHDDLCAMMAQFPDTPQAMQ